jgi:hypothetical protein
LIIAASLALAVAFPGAAAANHSWGNYHWARQSNPFTLKLGDNVNSAWDSYLGTTSSDWTASSVLNTQIVPGSGASKRRCPWTSGRVEVCNYAYGNVGWLGVAQIYVSGSHITQAQVKVNDTYFNTSTYNKPAWRNLVMCQEVGHTLGLDHQDENFSNTPLGTCMDYSNDPNPNQHPNAHDYEQLETIYAHLESTTTVLAAPPGKNGAAADGADAGAWGQLVALTNGGRTAVYVLDAGGGLQLFTFVIWA